MWSKSGVSEDEVKRTMLGCGYPNVAGTDRETSPHAGAEMFICMRKSGFKDYNNFGLCKFKPNLPACVEYLQGHPLTIEKLEQLPYKEDIAFAKRGPQWKHSNSGFCELAQERYVQVVHRQGCS